MSITYNTYLASFSQLHIRRRTNRYYNLNNNRIFANLLFNYLLSIVVNFKLINIYKIKTNFFNEGRMIK